jgi:cell division protein FtsL
MIQQQIIDYIKSQLKLGMNRDSIKNTLVSAGWSAEDVEDSIKNSLAAGVSEVSPTSSASPAGMNVGKNNAAANGPIVVSDMFNSSKMGAMPAAKEGKKDEPVKISSINMAAGNAVSVKEVGKTGSVKSTVAIIVLAIIAVGFGTGMVFLYLQNSPLNDKITSLQNDNATLNSKISTLDAQIADLTKERDDLKTSAGLLAAKNQEFLTELSFVFVPAGATSTEEQFTIKGMLSGGGKTQYSLLTADGIKLLVKNYKDAGVDAALKPLVGQTVEISGTHAPASKEVTVVAVNGAPATPPAPVPQASTSTPAASTSTPAASTSTTPNATSTLP